MEGLAIYTVPKDKPREKNIIEWPNGLEFDNDELAEDGQLFTCRLCKDGDKLKLIEIEGIKLDQPEQNSSGEGNATETTLPVMDGDDD